MLFAAFAALFLFLWMLLLPLLPLLRRAGALAAHLLARLSLRWGRVGRLTDRYRAYTPIVLVVLAGALLSAWTGDAFLDLAERVHARNPAVQEVDLRVHAWAIAQRTPTSTLFFSVMTTLGSPAALTLIEAVVAAILLIRKRFRWLLYLAVTGGGGALLDMELKHYFARARPDLADMLRQAHGYSFPSGHAMGSAVIFGTLSYLAFRTLRRWRWKSAALAFALTLILSVAASRVYLGVHWISDVAAGMAAGALWVVITTVAYETVRRIRMLRATSPAA